MNRLVVILTLIGTLALAVPQGMATSSPVPARHCGRVPEAFALNITARGLSCPAARRFVLAISDHRVLLKERRTRYRGFACQPRQVAVAEWALRCTSGLKVIAWLAGT